MFKIGECDLPEVVGGKGASLSVMKNLGLNVPPGITITTTAWKQWRAGKLSIDTLYNTYVAPLVKELFPRLGDEQMVSVRSGAPRSMPGMMDTIINLGAYYKKDKIDYLLSLAKARGTDMTAFHERIEDFISMNNLFVMEQINASSLLNILFQFGIKDNGRKSAQLKEAIELVFKSWDSERAQFYRELNGIPHDIGTACTIQLMARGTFGGSGVMLTRGAEDGPRIDWLPGENGEKVVDGSTTPLGIDELRDQCPNILDELLFIADKLEHVYHDAMDIEFTFESDTLYILQCRVAKRTPHEAMRIAVQLAHLMDKQKILDTPLVESSREVVEVEGGEELFRGEPVLNRPVSGLLCAYPNNVSQDPIVVRTMTTVNDIEMISQCVGVITIYGGPTCHAALVAREMDIPTIVGAGMIQMCTGFLRTYRSGKEERIKYGTRVIMLPDGRVMSGDANVTVCQRPSPWAEKLAELKERILKGEQ